ncbi:hypothetical protein POM88_003863 [Heracleum sosnowskyi]|uniref:OTU domain-containing protein n=1 Tax=Heracleum sosnowskyi TaxID=360622 RepID=A0AAD8JI98_9APIA|nr:hypothetical protein POM88_003863 [Heracleum sosnowskyi]
MDWIIRTCLFRALSDQFYRSPEHHKFVRRQIIAQLKLHPDLYKGYVPMAYGDYLKKMSKNGEWGDHITLQAASDSVLNCMGRQRKSIARKALPSEGSATFIQDTHKSVEAHSESIKPSMNLNNCVPGDKQVKLFIKLTRTMSSVINIFVFALIVYREGVEQLPQIPRCYLMIKNVTLTISFIKKYLVQKLGLDREDEVEISLWGMCLPQDLELHQLADMWSQAISDSEKLQAAVGDSTEEFVMVLTYGRKHPDHQ